MTAMTKVNEPALTALTVGQVAEQFDVTVRTLHHYDQIGLLVPSERTSAGYRLYGGGDITRLQHVVVYRRLGFALEQIALLLDDPSADLGEHLRHQREAVMSRLDEMQDLVTAIDRALEKEMSGIKLTKQERRELFGAGFSDDYAQEAKQRWGDTEEYQESQRRAAQYTKQQWQQIKAEGDANHGEFAAAMNDGEPATSERAMVAAEQHRQLIEKWFNPVPYPMHKGMSDMYVTDPRFTKTYEDIAPGLAQYVRDAIHANADRAAPTAASES
jgi:MerR family transcriptional regulator, thiopeptide resistance regulator